MRRPQFQTRLEINELYSRYVNAGLFYLNQIAMAKYDVKIHSLSGDEHC